MTNENHVLKSRLEIGYRHLSQGPVPAETGRVPHPFLPATLEKLANKAI